MDAALTELARLEQLTADAGRSSAKSKSTSIQNSLDSLLDSLNTAKTQLVEGGSGKDVLRNVSDAVAGCRKEVDYRQKEIYNSVSKIGKALDKHFNGAELEYDPLFTSPSAVAALERTIALHYLRTGQFDIAHTLIEEAGIDVQLEEAQYSDLYNTLVGLRTGNIEAALEWASANREFLDARNTPLEFELRRAEYIALLERVPGPGAQDAAIAYAKTHLYPFYSSHVAEIHRLMACLAFLPPKQTLQKSPYPDIAAGAVAARTQLEPRLVAAWCARAGLGRHAPLRVVADLGGSSALARIEKAKKVMRDRKSGWSQVDELPIEIPLPAEYRYHSVFICPVSKEQGTEKNPPMMLSCGHVISKESLEKLVKSQGRIKCPYCPLESLLTSALRVHF